MFARVRKQYQFGGLKRSVKPLLNSPSELMNIVIFFPKKILGKIFFHPPGVLPFLNENSCGPSDNLSLACHFKIASTGFPGDPVVKNLLTHAGDTSSIPDPGRSHMPQGS